MSILIKNGVVVDGTGHSRFPADVVVDGDRISDIILRDRPSQLCDANFDEVVDAEGLLVTPGFIDSHAHSDTYLLIEPDAPSKLSQGVTTEINGQCGGSAIPRFGEARLSSDWASMRYPKLSAGSGETEWAQGPTWRTLEEYRRLFDAVRPAVNTVQFVGHNTLRSSVIGYAALAATRQTQAAMEKLLAQELDAGGWGLTTGLIYQPGKYSNSAEVESLAKIAAARGGYYATHMRSEGDGIMEAIDEVLNLVRATGIRAEISHLKTSGKQNWHKIDAVLEKLQVAVDDGLLLGSDRYPYCAAGTDLDVVFPDWAGEGGLAAEMERLKNPSDRFRIIEELNASPRDWSTVMIGGTWSEKTKAYSGCFVSSLNAQKSVGELIVDTLLADEGRTGGFFFGMSEKNLHGIFSMPWVVPGSDASLRAPWGVLGNDHPHPRAYGTMPRFFRILTGRVEGHERICSAEEAIARMTSVPAKRFGIKGRGVIEKGAFADLAVWHEDTFRDSSSYDNPHRFSLGMKAVVVNGVLSYFDGKFTGKRNGRFLER